MRHGVKLNHLGRKSAHRKALLSHLACDLIKHKRIITTLAKAKALRVYVEPLITKSKTNTTHQRRVVFSYLQDKEAVTELFTGINAKVADRPGGYTRIIKLGARLGDAAEMGLIELVDYNELYTKEAPGAGKKRRTRRGRRKSSAETSTETKAEAPVAEEKPKEEIPAAEVPEEKAAPETEAKPAVKEKTKPATEEKVEEPKDAEAPKKKNNPKKKDEQ